jgi:hypothetical protein
MAIIDFDLKPIHLAELVRGYRLLVRATPHPRAQPVQDAIDTIAAELSQRNYIICDCESGRRRMESYDEYQSFLFWACEDCRDDKYHHYYKRG